MSTSTTVSMLNMTCFELSYGDESAQMQQCSYNVASSYELHVVLPDAALYGSDKGNNWAHVLAEQQSLYAGNNSAIHTADAPTRGTVTVERVVTDSK